MPTKAIDPDGAVIIIVNNKHHDQVIADLGKIYATRRGRKIINKLASSSTVYRIDGSANSIKGSLISGTRYNRLTNKLKYTQKTAHTDNVSTPSYVILGHEIYHALQDEVNAPRHLTTNPKKYEQDAMRFENYLRDVYGLGAHRTKHGGVPHLKNVTALSSIGERIDASSVNVSKMFSGRLDDGSDDIQKGNSAARDNTSFQLNTLNIDYILEYMDKNGIQKLNIQFDQRNKKP